MTTETPNRLFGLDRQSLLMIAAFAVAGLVALLAASGLATLVERQSTAAVKSRFLAEGITWIEVTSDGLQVQLSGTAPDEAQRYRAVNIAGAVIESSRLRDQMEVAPARAFEAPRFALEILRNDDGLQLIGLVPEGGTRDTLLQKAQSLAGDSPVSDMIETAAYPPQETWDAALAFGLEALALLPRSKISIDSARIEVTAIAASDAEKRQMVDQLVRAKPEGVELRTDISAPRPVLTPFTLRFVRDPLGARFDSCSADTEAARRQIQEAGAAAGIEGTPACVIGLGVPTPSWAAATSAGIAALGQIGQGTITFKDADVTLLAAAGTPQDLFDRVVGELETALPPVFSLDARIEKSAETGPEGPARFTATLAPETGKVELRGRLPDETVRQAVESFAAAKFGASDVFLATRTDPALPQGWVIRVLAGLEALALLENGSLLVQQDRVEVKGTTGAQGARARISQILSEKLGKGKVFVVDVAYDERLDPVLGLPTPQECLAALQEVLAKRKISFKPGSAEIESQAQTALDDLAAILKTCKGAALEVGGHTDAQGSDQGNLALSQARAEAVVIALQGRQIDVTNLIAKGYGETVPVADNATRAGQEANRRIEFRLLNAGAPGNTPADAASPAAPPPADAAGPADDGPSLAPTEKTMAPKPRPQTED